MTRCIICLCVTLTRLNFWVSCYHGYGGLSSLPGVLLRILMKITVKRGHAVDARHSELLHPNSVLFIDLYMYMCINRKDADNFKKGEDWQVWPICMSTYIYIYIHTHLYMHIRGKDISNLEKGDVLDVFCTCDVCVIIKIYSLGFYYRTEHTWFYKCNDIG